MIMNSPLSGNDVFPFVVQDTGLAMTLIQGEMYYSFLGYN
jgi:hypothetical protein